MSSSAAGLGFGDAPELGLFCRRRPNCMMPPQSSTLQGVRSPREGCMGRSFQEHRSGGLSNQCGTSSGSRVATSGHNGDTVVSSSIIAGLACDGCSVLNSGDGTIRAAPGLDTICAQLHRSGEGCAGSMDPAESSRDEAARMSESARNNGITRPTMCPFCKGKVVDTLAKVITEKTFWRCRGCEKTWTIASLPSSGRRPN